MYPGPGWIAQLWYGISVPSGGRVLAGITKKRVLERRDCSPHLRIFSSWTTLVEGWLALFTELFTVFTADYSISEVCRPSTYKHDVHGIHLCPHFFLHDRNAFIGSVNLMLFY